MNSEERSQLIEELKDPEYRAAFGNSMLDTLIAAQIRANRKARKLTQAELGEMAGMKQSFISSQEDVSNSSWTLKTLRRLASAFDLRLVVRFESWSSLFNGIRTDGELVAFDDHLLVRSSFNEDQGLSSSRRWAITGAEVSAALSEFQNLEMEIKTLPLLSRASGETATSTS